MKAVDHFFKTNNVGSDERYFSDSICHYKKVLWNKVAMVAIDNFVSQYSLGYTYWEFDNTGKIRR